LLDARQIHADDQIVVMAHKIDAGIHRGAPTVHRWNAVAMARG
jgi:hypothetical protein